jgi:hypothetical protein
MAHIDVYVAGSSLARRWQRPQERDFTGAAARPAGGGSGAVLGRKLVGSTRASLKGLSDWFTGDVWIDGLVQPTSTPR